MSKDISNGCQNFIQWKGTDVCMDFHCECGNSFHVDDDFAYALKCLQCGKVWKLGTEVSVTELTDKDDYSYTKALLGSQTEESQDEEGKR